ncbi:MAG: NAD(P)/FAD-dependent oxidoreductase [Rickettsiales bacterium]|nr:NAD(P)/FAD-dependent oxidoreductase [Rickettsiales bacterium]
MSPHPEPQTYETDVAIIGAGPVGLFAIFELGMLKIKCHVIDALDSIGGQCTALYPEKPIYDIPAHPSIDGQELVDKLAEQAAPFEPTYHLDQQVTHVEKTEDGFEIKTSKAAHIKCKAVLIAAGCGAFGPNRPPIDGLDAYEQTGCIRYMVTQKALFAGKKVAIAGGGDSAIDWTNALAPLTEKLYLIHRRDKFRAMPESVDQMRKLVDDGKVELVVPYQLDSLKGTDGHLSHVVVSTLDGQKRDLGADYLLPFYGLAMELGPIADWGLNLHMNHIEVDPLTCKTNIDGIFAIGDIATYEKKLKLILCGFSEAAMAAHAIRDLVYPDTAYHFEYSTSKGVPA